MDKLELLAQRIDQLETAVYQLCELLSCTENIGIKPYRPGAEEIARQLEESVDEDVVTADPTLGCGVGSRELD